LNLGTGLHIETGVPINDLLPHPVYLNADEVPINGRGSLGRTATFYQVDLHADYPWAISERYKLTLIGDFFNVTNVRKLRYPDQFQQLDLGVTNTYYLQPSTINLTSGYHLPFNMRLGLRFEF
jgi:hypothetical protein